jgi:hypothetical protein
VFGQGIETEGALIQPGAPEQRQNQQGAGDQQQGQHRQAADEEDGGGGQGIGQAAPEHVLAMAAEFRDSRARRPG